MAIPEDDRVIRRTGGFRDQSNTSMVSIVAAVVIIGLILMYMFVPRSGEPVSSIDGAARAPVTSTSPTPATTPNRP